MRRINEGLVGDDVYRQGSWHWHYEVEREIRGMTAKEL